MDPPIKFYADEHIATAVVDGLKLRGVDVLTALEAGCLSASDLEHLARARAESRAIITQDADFLRLHEAGMEHYGIVYAPQGSSIGAILRLLLLIHEVYSSDELKGAVEFL